MEDTEKKVYQDAVESLSAEKVALDQMLVESLKSSLAAKKDVLLKEEQIRKLKIDVDVLKKEKEVLQKQLNDLKCIPEQTSE